MVLARRIPLSANTKLDDGVSAPKLRTGVNQPCTLGTGRQCGGKARTQQAAAVAPSTTEQQAVASGTKANDRSLQDRPQLKRGRGILSKLLRQEVGRSLHGRTGISPQELITIDGVKQFHGSLDADTLDDAVSKDRVREGHDAIVRVLLLAQGGATVDTASSTGAVVRPSSRSWHQVDSKHRCLEASPHGEVSCGYNDVTERFLELRNLCSQCERSEYGRATELSGRPPQMLQ